MMTFIISSKNCTETSEELLSPCPCPPRTSAVALLSLRLMTKAEALFLPPSQLQLKQCHLLNWAALSIYTASITIASSLKKWEEKHASAEAPILPPSRLQLKQCHLLNWAALSTDSASISIASSPLK